MSRLLSSMEGPFKIYSSQLAVVLMYSKAYRPGHGENPMVDIRVPCEAFKQSMGQYLYLRILAAKIGENGVRQNV